MSLIDKIRALIAHAEDSARSGRAEEAEVYEAKALELMTDHAIDQALLDAGRPTRRQIDTIIIDGSELPPTYQKAHANGLAYLAEILGGYAYWTYPYASTRVTRIRVAIDNAEAFRHLVLGLAAIAATQASMSGTEKAYRWNFIRGFWSGCWDEANKRRDQHTEAGVSNALVLVSSQAKEQLTKDAGKIRAYRPPATSYGFRDGVSEGVAAYRSFGRVVSA